MENIGASVSAVLTAEKKEAEVKKVVEVAAEEEEEEVVEEEYHQMENEMIFCLKEAPEYQISAVAEWGENSQGDIVVGADIYFLHTRTGARCESVWSSITWWLEPHEDREKWETLCGRIDGFENLEQTICDEKRVEL